MNKLWLQLSPRTQRVVLAVMAVALLAVLAGCAQSSGSVPPPSGPIGSGCGY